MNVLNTNMNLISIILYLCGIVGIFIFFLFIVLAIKKQTKASTVLSVLMLILSIILLGSGCFLKITYNKKHPQPVANAVIDQAKKDNENLNQTSENKKASIDDLKFEYTLSSYDSKNQTANMTIKNNSNAVFNGHVKVSFLDSSKQIINSLKLNIKNLIPNKTFSPDAFVSSNVSTIEYSFSGNFTEETLDQVPYSISKVSTGNKFIRINVTVNDTSKDHLEQVCNTLAADNSGDEINGLLVYFYPENVSSNQLNFDNIIADYYLNNVNKTSKFTYYN